MPKVFDCVDVVAARAGRDVFVATRAVVVLPVPRAGDLVARPSDVVRAAVTDCAPRAEEPVRTRCAARAVVVRVFVFCVARDAVPRVAADCVPDVRGVTLVRETVGAGLDVFLDIASPSRTAALAMPTLTIYAIIRSPVLFIP